MFTRLKLQDQSTSFETQKKQITGLTKGRSTKEQETTEKLQKQIVLASSIPPAQSMNTQ